eukprot:5039871-Prymnesium_polylepis.1
MLATAAAERSRQTSSACQTSRSTLPYSTVHAVRLKEKTESGYEVTVVGAVAERPNRWWAGRGRVPHR